MSDSEEETVDKQVKIILIGEAGTGKTCLVSRYCHNEFSRQYFPTEGIDFMKRTVISGTRNVTLEIWDISGQALSGNMLDKYVFGANVILLVYDVTNATTFDCLEDWLEAVRRITMNQDRTPTITVVGNKCDMEHQRTVRVERQQRFAQENGLSHHVVSARTGESVTVSFQKIVAETLGIKLTRAELEDQQTVMKAELVLTTTEAPTSRMSVSTIPVPSKPTVLCVIQ